MKTAILAIVMLAGTAVGIAGVETDIRAGQGAAAIITATAEYDAILHDWKQGQSLALRHQLFALDYVKAGGDAAATIHFEGRSFGAEGEIFLTFYTLEGDMIHLHRTAQYSPRVDRERTRFTVASMVPRQLRGRSGTVEIAFRGKDGKRAAFLVKADF